MLSTQGLNQLLVVGLIAVLGQNTQLSLALFNGPENIKGTNKDVLNIYSVQNQ